MFFGILFTLIFVLCVAEFVRLERKRIQKKEEMSMNGHEADEIKDDILPLTVEDFDKYFNRTAGRYCAHCDAHGSHHTDRHNDYGYLMLSKMK